MSARSSRRIALALCLVMSPALPSPVSAASFSCDRQDLAADETLICQDRTLNDMDVKMATTYDLLTGLMPMGNRDILRDDQAAWLKTRQACGANADCLKQAYAVRMEQLQEAYKGLIKPL